MASHMTDHNGVIIPNFTLVNPNFASLVTDHNGVIVPNYPLVNPNFAPPVRYAVNPSVLAQLQFNLSVYLQQLMKDEGLVPTKEDERKRDDVIRKLKEIVFKWIKSVANLHRLPQNKIRAASATILTYGSYGLGVYNADSDIDAVCVGPEFANLRVDFFIGLHNRLADTVEVSDIQCVKDAKVPLMKFKIGGISVDLPYAQLKVTTVPENVDILSPSFLRGIDETSRKSLSGVCANISILQLVPNAKIFQELLRCVKHWAKRRGVYGNLFGFFGGVHLAVLAAFVCQSNPNVSLAGLVSNFFKTFALWPWPAPVILQQGIMVPPRHHKTRSLMPIQLPSSPHEFCHSNVTTCTFMKIIHEFQRGYCITQDIFTFDWRNLFVPYPYSKNYQQFLKVCLSASSQEENLGVGIGWVKSRLPGLLKKLEEFHAFYDPNPTEYSDATIQDRNVIFYWGIVVSNILDVNVVQREYDKYLYNSSTGAKGKISLSVIRASQLPKNLQVVDNPYVH